jgi:hypothetical protein
MLSDLISFRNTADITDTGYGQNSFATELGDCTSNRQLVAATVVDLNAVFQVKMLIASRIICVLNLDGTVTCVLFYLFNPGLRFQFL